MPGDSNPPVEEGEPQVDIEAIERDKARLSQIIDKTGKELGDMIGRLSTEANQVANKVSDEASAVMNYHRSASRKIMETVNNEEASVRETVFSLASSLDYFFWVVAGLLVGFGLVTGYIVSSVSRIYLGIFSLVWIVTGLGILFILRSKVSALRSRSNDLGQVKEMQEEMTEMVVSLPQPQPDVQLFESSAKALGEAVGTLTSAASDLVRIDKRSMKLRSQEQFVQSFLLALNHYGFVIEAQSVEKFRKVLVSVDEVSYLESLTSECKEMFPSVAQAILKLAYFDCQGYSKEADQTLEVIKKTPSLRIQLANLLIRNKLLTASNTSESFVPALSELLMNLQTYSLDAVKVESAGFIERLAAFKVETINHLALFDLNIVEGVVELMAFMPKSSSSEKWRNEVLEYIARELLEIDPNFVELLVRDAIGDGGKTKYWRLIVKSNSLLILATILAKKRLAPVHSEFDQNVYLRHLVLAMQASHDEFSLQVIEKNLRMTEDIMITVEKNVKRTSQLYRLQLNDFAYLRSYVPKTIETTEDELIAASAHRLSLKPKIFELLYFSAVGSDRVTKSFNEVIGDEQTAKLLADFLLSSGFVPKGGFSKSLVLLLRARKSFDLTNLMFDYSRYEKLLESSENLWAFMKKKDCCERARPLSFDEILLLYPPDSSLGYEDQLVAIARKLIPSKFGKNELTVDQQDQTALAATSLFLIGVGDSTHRLLFAKIAVKPFACRILYRYIYLIDQSVIVRTEPRLDEAVVDSLELHSDDAHFNYFKSQLAEGRFLGSAGEVINIRMDDISAHMRKLKKAGFDSKLLDGLVTPLRHVLYDSLDLDMLQTLLTTQTLVAYTLTIPPNHPMNAIIDSTELLEASGDALGLKDGSKYRELVRLSRPTRIGLVPLEMSFETFASKFEEVFRGALKMYSAKLQNSQNSDFRSFYMTRIFPSTTSHREISSMGEAQKTFEMIRILARSSMTAVECLMLLALLQPVDRTEVAVRNVLQSVLDSSELKLFYQDIDQSKEIQLKFADHTLDTALMSEYNVTKLSSLCKALGEEFQNMGEERARKKFYECMKKALPEGLKLSPHKEELFMKTLFKRMSSLGALFRT